jgi:hypothetical protein
MWTYINHYASELFINPFYLPPLSSPDGSSPIYTRIPRIPTTIYFELAIWKELFLRYSMDNPKYLNLGHSD